MANGNKNYLTGPRDTNFTSRSLMEDIFGRKTGGEQGPWYGGGQDLWGGMTERGGIFDRGNRMQAGGGNLSGEAVGQGPSLLSGNTLQGRQQLQFLGGNTPTAYQNFGQSTSGIPGYDNFLSPHMGGSKNVYDPGVFGGGPGEIAEVGKLGDMSSATSGTPTASSTSSPTAAPSWLDQNKGKVAGASGALIGGVLGYRQAKQQKEGLGVAIEELDPLKGQFMGEHERQKGLAEAYRPGGKYSRYMAGQMYSQAAESVGQESQRMIASGITSPSMMRAMGRQSRRQTQAAMPGMELQLSQMALPYEKLAAGSMTQYGGVVEQLASLKGARASINPWASAISGASEGMMAAGNMMSSFMPG